jgi:hypothetical protein
MEPCGDYSLSAGLAISIDRIGQCSADSRSFVEIALAHTCRDLEAGFATPTDALICYEFGPETGTQEQVEIVRSLKAAADSRNISVGKCHSVLVDGTTSLVICVFGKQNRTAGDLPATGSVWLSHGLGASKLQYMREIGTLSDRTSAFELMISNVRTDVFGHRPCLIADVSGHGLAGTLVDLAERCGASINVSIGPALALSNDVLTEKITLFENDWSSYSHIIDVEDPTARRLASLKETAGPLIALTESIDRRADNSISDAGWFRIGHYEQGEAGVRIQWSE